MAAEKPPDNAVEAQPEPREEPGDSKLQTWQEFGHDFEPLELETLKRSIVEMALSRVDGPENIYVGG